jgi:hypothetical protein
LLSNILELKNKIKMKSLYFLSRGYVEPSSPNPFSRRRRGAKPYYFLVPLSCGRGARGEGFTNFHVTPVTNVDLEQIQKVSDRTKRRHLLFGT